MLVNLQTGIQIKILNKKSNLLFNKEIELRRWSPRANDPDANLFVQIKGAADLRTGSDIKLDDGKKDKDNTKECKTNSSCNG